MLDVVRADAFFARLLPEAEVEIPQFWNDAQTGLPCKARLDMRLPYEGLIVDVKTTSARSQREFEQNCYRYEYDRQAAFYLDGCQQAGHCADRFILLGIQKQKPHNLYVVEVLADSIFMDEGRRKYRRLLRSWQEIGFRPSSWGTEAHFANVMDETEESRNGPVKEYRKRLHDRFQESYPELLSVVEKWVDAGFPPSRIESFVRSQQPVNENLPVYMAEVAHHLTQKRLPEN